MANDKTGRVRKVIADTFGVAPEQIPDDAKMGSIPGWDSMGHMTLVVALEKEFGVSFPAYELAELVSVEQIATIVSQHGSA